MDSYCTGKVDVSILLLRLIYFDQLFWTPFWISNFTFLVENLQFEVRLHISKRLPASAGWQNLWINAIQPDQFRNGQVLVRSWSADWERCRILCILAPAIFSYCTSLVFSSGGYHDLLRAVVK